MLAMRSLYFIFVILIFSVVAHERTGFAQDDFPKFSVRVKLDISANDSMKDRLVSYISRELRSLGDVIITDKNPEYVIGILAKEVHNKGGDIIGAVYSVVVTRPFYVDNFLKFMSKVGEKLNDSTVLLMEMYLSNKETVIYNEILSGSREGLENISKSIVVSFDSILEQDRKQWEEGSEIIKKLKSGELE